MPARTQPIDWHRQRTACDQMAARSRDAARLHLSMHPHRGLSAARVPCGSLTFNTRGQRVLKARWTLPAGNGTVAVNQGFALYNKDVRCTSEELQSYRGEKQHCSTGSRDKVEITFPIWTVALLLCIVHNFLIISISSLIFIFNSNS
jgi:hypothetical protein